MTNTRLRDLINQKFSQEARFASKFLNHKPENERLFIEKLYHLNSYQNADPRDITINNISISSSRIDSTWTKGNNMVKNDSQWYIGSLPHRYDKPAVIHYNYHGKVMTRIWYQIGLLHRVGGPAIINYNEKGQVLRKEWYQNGRPVLVERLREA
jgi:hypothetical protein